MPHQSRIPTHRALPTNPALRAATASGSSLGTVTPQQIAPSRPPTQSLPAARAGSTPRSMGLTRSTNIQSIVEPTPSSHAASSTVRGRDDRRQDLTIFRDLCGADISGGVYVNTSSSVNFYQENVPTRQTSDNDGNGTERTSINIHPTHDQCSTIATPEHSEYEIYCKYLSVKQRGSPLWEPGPRMTFPTEYRRNGVSIGDVGILNPTTGYFAFLFNIFLPADHEINQGRVPNGFIPLDKSKAQKSITQSILYDFGSCLASSTLRQTNSSEFSFKTTGREGAVLVMPDGALTTDLEIFKLVEQYITINARSWWEYVQSDDCGVQNENVIQVVVGTDKVSTWGMATFENVNTDDPMQFELMDDGRGSQAQAYKWQNIHSGRVGPSEKELRGLRPLPDMPLCNQCVFIRTLNVSVSWRVRDESALHAVCSSCLGNCMSDLTSPVQRTVNIQNSKGGLPVSHPSKTLNEYLLEKFPDSEVVITSDSDWISVITENDTTMPSVEDICRRVLDSHVICEENGIVTLEKREDTDISLEAPEQSMAETLDIDKWPIFDSRDDVNCAAELGEPSGNKVDECCSTSARKTMDDDPEHCEDLQRLEEENRDTEIVELIVLEDNSLISGGGTTLISEDGMVQPWDGQKCAIAQQCLKSTKPVFSPDGTRLVSASEDGMARLWDGQTGAKSAVLQGHSNEVGWVGSSPDGTRLASAAKNGTVRLWDGQTATSTLRARSDQVNLVLVSSDRTTPASAFQNECDVNQAEHSEESQRLEEENGRATKVVKPILASASLSDCFYQVTDDTSNPSVRPSAIETKNQTHHGGDQDLAENSVAKPMRKDTSPSQSLNNSLTGNLNTRRHVFNLGTLEVNTTRLSDNQLSSNVVLDCLDHQFVGCRRLPTPPVISGTSSPRDSGSRPSTASSDSHAPWHPPPSPVTLYGAVIHSCDNSTWSNMNASSSSSHIEHSLPHQRHRSERFLDPDSFLGSSHAYNPDRPTPFDRASETSTQTSLETKQTDMWSRLSIATSTTSLSSRRSRAKAPELDLEIPSHLLSMGPLFGTSPISAEFARKGDPVHNRTPQHAGPSTRTTLSSYDWDQEISPQTTHNDQHLSPIEQAVQSHLRTFHVVRGTVMSGTLEGLIQFLLHNDYTSNYRDTFLTACSELTTPRGLFHRLARRIDEQQHRSEILVFTRYWLESNSFPPNEKLLHDIKFFCGEAVRRYPPLEFIAEMTARLIDAKLVPLHLLASKPQIPHEGSQITPCDLAVGLCLLEGDHYKALQPSDYLQHLSKGRSDRIEIYNETQEKIRLWVIRSILYYDTTVSRSQVLKHFIKTAFECYSMRNFSSTVAICIALQSVSIEYLKMTTKATMSSLSKKMRGNLQTLSGIIDPQCGHRGYFDALQASATVRDRDTCIPWLAVHLKELNKVLRQPLAVLVDDQYLVNFTRYNGFMDRIKETLYYSPPDLEDQRHEGQLAYLVNQLRNIDLSGDLEQRLLARGEELRARELSGHSIQNEHLRRVGFMP